MCQHFGPIFHHLSSLSDTFSRVWKINASYSFICAMGNVCVCVRACARACVCVVCEEKVLYKPDSQVKYS